MTFVSALETVWIETPQAADADTIADVVLMARNRGYVRGLERAAFKDAMYKHMSDCKATLRSAYNVEMVLSQAEAFGHKWTGAKR